MSARAFTIAGALCTFAGALGSRALLAHAPARFAPDLAQPVAVVTAWGAYGATLLAVLAAATAAATAAYALAVTACEREPASARRGWAWIALGAAAGLAAAWAFPAIFSSDVYAYAAYGEMAKLGLNPYGHAPLPAGNPIFAAAIWQWGNPPPVCVYGPAFVALARGVVGAWPIVPNALEALRLVASFALVLCAPLAYAAYPGTPAQRAAAAATIALNPVAVWSAAEGHNDALALAVVLAGFAWLRRSPAAGAAVVALAGSIKLPGAAPAFALLALARTRAGAAAGLAVVAALSVPLAVGVLTRLAPQGHFAPQASLQGLLEPLIGLALHANGAAGAVTWLLAAAAAVALARPGLRALREGRIEGWLPIALGAWVLIPNPQPWYGVWFAAVAALAPASRAGVTLLALGLFSLLRYVPDAVGAPSPAGGVLLGLAACMPLAAMIRPRGQRIAAR